MNKTKDTPKGCATGDGHHGTMLPSWLDSRTVAIMTTMLTIAAALGAMVQTAHSGLRDDIDQLRQDMTGMGGELRAEIDNVRVELSADIENVRVELSTDIENVRVELSADINALDTRLRRVEIDVAAIRERLSAVEVDVSAIRMAMTGFDARSKAVEGQTHGDHVSGRAHRRDG